MMDIDNYRDLQMRFLGTYIMFRGDVVHVRNISEETMKLTLYNLNTKREHLVSHNNPHLSIKPIPLGYFNYMGHAIFIARHPERKYKQGVDLSRLFWYPTRVRVAGDRLAEDGFVNMVTNKYPTFQEAVEEAFEKSSCAFSRKLAVSKASIYYMSTIIGDISKCGKNIYPIVLRDKYKYMKEYVEEVANVNVV